MTIQEQLENLQNQQESGSWFDDIVYNPFQSVYWDYTDIGGPEDIQAEMGAMFPAFNESEWAMIDEHAQLTSDNLNTEFNLWNTTAQSMMDFKNQQLQSQTDLKLKGLESQDEFSRKKTNLDKKIMLDKAFQSITQADTIAGKTNLGSGTNVMNRKIAEDSVISQVSSANMNRKFARTENKRKKENIVTNFENTKDLAQLTYDTQYDTKFQDKENKLSMIGLTSAMDKINGKLVLLVEQRN